MIITIYLIGIIVAVLIDYLIIQQTVKEFKMEYLMSSPLYYLGSWLVAFLFIWTYIQMKLCDRL